MSGFRGALWAPRLYQQTKKNASRREIQFDLTMEQMERLVARANGRCEVSGVPFVLRSGSVRGEKRPFAPSLDRKNSSGGYTYTNCRLVCVAANLAMNEWGDGVLRALASGLAGDNGGALSAAADEIQELRRKLSEAEAKIEELREHIVRVEDQLMVRVHNEEGRGSLYMFRLSPRPMRIEWL